MAIEVVGEKLIQQVAVGTVDLDPVKPGRHGPTSSGDESPTDVGDVGAVHGRRSTERAVAAIHR